MTIQQEGKVWYLLSVIWTIVVLVLLFSPSKTVGVDRIYFFPGEDKVVHSILFAIWIFLIAKAFSKSKKSISPMTLLFIFITIALLTEVIQSHIGRSFEWLDVLADVIGAAIGLLIYKSV